MEKFHVASVMGIITDPYHLLGWREDSTPIKESFTCEGGPSTSTKKYFYYSYYQTRLKSCYINFQCSSTNSTVQISYFSCCYSHNKIQPLLYCTWIPTYDFPLHHTYITPYLFLPSTQLTEYVQVLQNYVTPSLNMQSGISILISMFTTLLLCILCDKSQLNCEV